MYRIYSVTAGAIKRNELKTFQPLINSHEYQYMDAHIIPQPDIKYAAPAHNARPFGPELNVRLAPPNFEIVFAGEKAVQLRIGPDMLHPQSETHQISDITEAQTLAETRIDVLSRANYMLDRCTMNELERIDMKIPEARLSFLLAAGEPGLTRNTIVEDALVMATCELGRQVSALTVQKLLPNFVSPYFAEINKHAHHSSEDVARALKIACVQLAESEVNAYDRGAIAEFSQSIASRTETLWKSRNEKVWKAWQETPESLSVPAKFSAVFQDAFLHEINQCLNDTNWVGDMALIYTAAYDAAYRAGEQALQQEDIATTEQYAKVQEQCTAALDVIRQDSDRNADPVDREYDRGYQPYENQTDGSQQPQGDDDILPTGR